MHHRSTHPSISTARAVGLINFFLLIRPLYLLPICTSFLLSLLQVPALLDGTGTANPNTDASGISGGLRARES